MLLEGGTAKYVTIATDVSCDSKYKISTWACYIRYSGGAIKLAREFREYHPCTAVAETHALINALTIARSAIPDWSQSKVVIHNEIDYVLNPIKTRAGNIRKRDSARAEAIEKIALPILNEAVSWDKRTIKAHYKDWKTSENPAKYALNRWCDTESRRLLKTIRKEKKHQ